MRGVAATALGNIKDNRASDALAQTLLKDQKPMVRMQAATALGKIKDPKSLESLKMALDDEKDERVKMAVAGAVRALIGEGDATAKVPTPDEAAKQLMPMLAKDMRSVEDKLRGDRHDDAVQVEGKQIEDHLASLIEKLNQAMQRVPARRSRRRTRRSRNSSSRAAGQQNNGKGASPMADSKAGRSVAEGATNAALGGQHAGVRGRNCPARAARRVIASVPRRRSGTLAQTAGGVFPVDCGGRGEGRGEVAGHGKCDLSGLNR